MPRINTKILTTGILVVFRGLKFESDTDIGEKDGFRLGTIYIILLNFLPIHLIPGKYASCQSVKSMFFHFFIVL